MAKVWINGLLLLTAVLLAGCKHAEKSSGKAEDFQVFYQRFLTDKDFQLSRIVFPLDGYDNNGETTKKWTAASSWRMVTGSIDKVDTKVYKVEKNFSPQEVNFRIYVENSGIDIRQKFQLKNGKWYLVEYINIFT